MVGQNYSEKRVVLHLVLAQQSAPVNNLGLVIVDEEHDSSFKQHSDVRYNGRDLALVRAHRADAVVVLGSGTLT